MNYRIEFFKRIDSRDIHEFHVGPLSKLTASLLKLITSFLKLTVSLRFYAFTINLLLGVI